MDKTKLESSQYLDLGVFGHHPGANGYVRFPRETVATREMKSRAVLLLPNNACSPEVQHDAA